MAATQGTYEENFGEKFQSHILAVMSRVAGALVRFRSAFSHNYFSSDVNRVVASAIIQHVDKYQSLPTVSMLVEEAKIMCGKEMAPAVEKAVEALWKDDISDSDAVLDKAVEFGKLQAMCLAVVQGAAKLDAGDRTAIMPLVQEAFKVGDDVTDMGIDYVNADRTKIYTDSTTEDCVPTGITHLDHLLEGGPVRGGVYLFLGVPKKGKSQCLVNVGFGALLNPDELDVVYASHEMSAKRILMRFDVRLAGKYLPLRKTDPAKYAEIMSERAALFVKGRLFIRSWPTRTCGVSGLRSWLSVLAGYGVKPSVVISDYADIMKPERRIGEMRHEQAGIYEDFRGLMGELNAVGWTGSQAKASAVEKETLDMGDFAEATEKGAIMDGGLAIAQTPDEAGMGRMRLVAVGLRDQQDQCTIECRIDRKRCLIQSTGLFDVAKMRIPTPNDDPDLADMPQVPTSKPAQKKNIYGGGYGGKKFSKTVPAGLLKTIPATMPGIKPVAKTPILKKG